MQYYFQTTELPPAFGDAWECALSTLRSQDKKIFWYPDTPYSPHCNQLSFTYGNQLFWVWIETPHHVLEPNSELFMDKAVQARAIPCLIRLYRKDGRYVPAHDKWGLSHALDNSIVHPPDLVSDELVERSGWEVQAAAVSIVCDTIAEGYGEVGRSHACLDVNPSIYFTESGLRSAVIVRAARLPQLMPCITDEIRKLAGELPPIDGKIYFAGLQAAHSEKDFEEENQSPERILRGEDVIFRSSGITLVE